MGSGIGRIVLNAAVYSVAVGPDGRTLVAGDASGSLWCLPYHALSY